MAPEQVRGKSGPAADIFAWGLTVAYAASGQPPFGTGPADVIFYRILHDDPDIEAVPESLKPLVSAALAKKPEDRPTARDLLSALAAGPDEAPVVAAPDAALQVMLSRTWVVPARRLPEATVLRRSRRRNLTSRYPFLLPSAGVAAVLICAGVAFGVSSTGQSGPATATVDPATRMCGLAPSLYTCLPTASGSYSPLPTSSGVYSYVYSVGPTAGPTYTLQPTAPAPLGTLSGVPASGDPSPANLWLEQDGWQPLNDGPGWNGDWGTLNVILARKSGSTSSGIEAFFFNQNSPVGVDVPDYTGSTSLQAYRLTQDTIDIRYKLENAPSSAADVRFQLQDGELFMLDSLPATHYRHW
jgi:hypothetical protein